MDIAIITAIIAATVSISSLFISNLLLLYENRKNRYTTLISTQTLKNMLYVRENVSELLTMTDPDVIDALRQRADLIYKLALMKSYNNIIMQFKAHFPKEVDIVNTLKGLIRINRCGI